MRDRLVKAMLKKAIDTSALTTTQDLRFVLQVYLDTQDWNSAVVLLDNEKLGLFSALGKADIEFIRIKLTCLAMLQRWQDLKHFCAFIIKGDIADKERAAELRQWQLDSTVWDHLTQALAVVHRGDHTFNFSDYTSKLLPNANLSSSSSRVMWISQMRFAAVIMQGGNSDGSAALSSTCEAYLLNYLNKRYCFEDLQPYLVLLPSEACAHLLKQAHSCTFDRRDVNASWEIAELNCLKMEHLLSLSRTQDPPSKLAYSYAVSVLRFISTLFALGIKDEFLLEEVFLLAAAALQKLIESHETSVEHSATLLQAIAVLEHSLKNGNAPTSYRARLALVKFYRRHGCLSLAMQHYQALRIREIQNDTVSHLLYHRISLLHPFRTDDTGNRGQKLDQAVANPTLGLQNIINWYDVAIDRTNGFVSRPIDSLRYDKVQEFVGLKDQLARSLQRQLTTLERRRIARLVDRVYDETDNNIDFLNSVWVKDLADMRDFNRGTAFRVAGDSEWHAEDAEDIHSALYYTAVMSELDAAQSLLTAKDPVLEHKNSLIRLKHAAEVLKTGEPIPNPIPDDERSTYLIVQRLRPLILGAVLGDKQDIVNSFKMPSVKDTDAALLEAADFIAVLQPLSRNEKHRRWQLPDDGTICTLVCQLDCLKTIAKLTDLLGLCSKQKSHPFFKKIKSETLTQMKKDAMRKGDVMQNAVQDWRAYIKSSWRTMLDPIPNDTNDVNKGDMEAEIVSIVGKGYMLNTLAPSLRDSMIDTLDGILKIRIGA